MSVSLTDQNSTSRSHASPVYRLRPPTRHLPPQQHRSRPRNVDAAGLLLSMGVGLLTATTEGHRVLAHSDRRSPRRRTPLHPLPHMPNRHCTPTSIRGRTTWDHHNSNITGTLATAAAMDYPISPKGGITHRHSFNSMRPHLPGALVQTVITPMREGILIGARAPLLDPGPA